MLIRESQGHAWCVDSCAVSHWLLANQSQSHCGACLVNAFFARGLHTYALFSVLNTSQFVILNYYPMVWGKIRFFSLFGRQFAISILCAA